MISKEDIIKVASLSRLSLSEKEIEQYQQEFTNILGFFENGKQYRASKFHNLDTFKKTLFNKDEIVKLLPKL